MGARCCSVAQVSSQERSGTHPMVSALWSMRFFAGHLDKLLCVGVGGANLNHETFQRTVNNCMNSALLTCSLSLRPGFCQRLQPKRDIARLQTVVSGFLEQSKQSLRDPHPFRGGRAGRTFTSVRSVCACLGLQVRSALSFQQ